MDKLNHIKEPLHVVGANETTDGVNIWNSNGVRDLIANVKFRGNLAECEATAKVMAASNDLLTACFAALDELNKWAETYPEDEDLPDVIEQVEDAIIKATQYD